MTSANKECDLHSGNCILEQKLGPIVGAVAHRETNILNVASEVPQRQRLVSPCAQDCNFPKANPYSHFLVALSILHPFRIDIAPKSMLFRLGRPCRQRLGRPSAQGCNFLTANPYSHSLVALSILHPFRIDSAPKGMLFRAGSMRKVRGMGSASRTASRDLHS